MFRDQPETRCMVPIHRSDITHIGRDWGTFVYHPQVLVQNTGFEPITLADFSLGNITSQHYYTLWVITLAKCNTDKLCSHTFRKIICSRLHTFSLSCASIFNNRLQYPVIGYNPFATPLLWPHWPNYKTWSEYKDSNLGPLRPKRSALIRLSYTPKLTIGAGDRTRTYTGFLPRTSKDRMATITSHPHILLNF